MPDFTKIRSLEDLAAARQKLQQRADQQSAVLQKDVARIQREVSLVLNRFRKVGHMFSSVASLLNPFAIIAPHISKGTLLFSLLRRLLRRVRKH